MTSYEQVDAPGLLTVREVATALRLSPDAVRMQIHSGALPAIRVSPRGLRVDAADLAAYIAETSARRERNRAAWGLK